MIDIHLGQFGTAVLVGSIGIAVLIYGVFFMTSRSRWPLILAGIIMFMAAVVVR